MNIAKAFGDLFEVTAMMVILFTVGVACGSREDPCALVASQKITVYQMAMECYRNFKLERKVKSSTLDTLRRTISLVSLNPKVSSILHDGLVEIEKETFLNEYDFHTKLSALYSIEEIKYDSGCFSSFVFHLPLELVVKRQDDRMVVKISTFMSYSEDLLPHWNHFGFDAKALQGKEVKKIDSQHAILYLVDLANKQDSLHFNALLSRAILRGGTWTLEPGSFARSNYPPKSSHLMVEFDGGEVIYFPFLVTIPQGFNDSFSFYKNMCMTKPTVDEYAPNQELVIIDQKKAVFVISDFSDIYSWEKQVYNTLMHIGSVNADELVLDLRDSSGDYFCGSYHLAEYLTSNLTRKHFPLYFPNFPLIDTISTKCRLATNPCSQIFTALKATQCGPSFLKGLPPLHNVASIKLITNGICDGACAILVHSLLQPESAELYFLGPPIIQPAVGPSGTPFSLKQLSGLMLLAEVGSDIQIPPLPTGADLYFSLAHPYTTIRTKKFLLDQLPPGVIYHINDSDQIAFNPINLWKNVLRM
ncbi:hypothetical protein DSO57_1025410 [Entomophthora muscae]|uniref:Uncharacterized protein n=1 Tax=Entomophthora muscae TaxID=34485 RepID=A0ACC2SF33_9FUNG|nr:hypothetical protein DSO57_1025410 [Entomophthora muscae]